MAATISLRKLRKAEQAIRGILSDPDFTGQELDAKVQRLMDSLTDAIGFDPERYAGFINKQAERWRRRHAEKTGVSYAPQARPTAAPVANVHARFTAARQAAPAAGSSA